MTATQTLLRQLDDLDRVIEREKRALDESKQAFKELLAQREELIGEAKRVANGQSDMFNDGDDE